MLPQKELRHKEVWFEVGVPQLTWEATLPVSGNTDITGTVDVTGGGDDGRHVNPQPGCAVMHLCRYHHACMHLCRKQLCSYAFLHLCSYGPKSFCLQFVDPQAVMQLCMFAFMVSSRFACKSLTGKQ